MLVVAAVAVAALGLIVIIAGPPLPGVTPLAPDAGREDKDTGPGDVTMPADALILGEGAGEEVKDGEPLPPATAARPKEAAAFAVAAVAALLPPGPPAPTAGTETIFITIEGFRPSSRIDAKACSVMSLSALPSESRR